MLLYCARHKKVVNDMFKESCDYHAICAGCPEIEPWKLLCNYDFDARVPEFLDTLSSPADLRIQFFCQYRRQNDDVSYCLFHSDCDFLVELKIKE